MFVNSLRVPNPRPPQPHTKRGAFGARRPKGGTHAKAPLPSFVAALSLSPFSLRLGLFFARAPTGSELGTRLLGGRRPFPPSLAPQPRTRQAQAPARFATETEARGAGAGGGTQGASLRPGATPRAPAPSAPGAGRLGSGEQSARGRGRWSARLGMFARCSPCRVSCPWRLLGAIPVSLIETRLQEGSSSGERGLPGGRGGRGGPERLRRAAAGHRRAALLGDCYFETGLLSPPGRRMQGSSVTSSGSQSPIFLVMFLNGRIHYARTGEWGRGRQRARSIASANGSFCTAERGPVEPKEEPDQYCLLPRRHGRKGHLGKAGECRHPDRS